MAVPTTSLSRATNGDWFARKGIPKDVRAAYKAAFGVSQEERFRRPRSLSTGAAKAELREAALHGEAFTGQDYHNLSRAVNVLHNFPLVLQSVNAASSVFPAQ